MLTPSSYEAEAPAAKSEEDDIQIDTSAQSPPVPTTNDADAEMTTGDAGDAGTTGDAHNHQHPENGSAHDEGDVGWQTNDIGTDNGHGGSTAAPEHSGIAIKEDG